MDLYLISTGALVILLFALGFNVSRLRAKHNMIIGTGDDRHPLTKAIRAHGNAAEYVPVLAAVFLYLALSGSAGWVAWLAVVVTLARFCHSAGMLLSDDLAKPHVLRALGAFITYLGGLALGILLIGKALL